MTVADVRLRRIVRPREDPNHPGLPVLSVYRDHGVVPKDSRTDNYNKTPDDLSRYLRVRPDDLVVNKMKAWSGSVAVSAHDGLVSGDYLVCELLPGILPRYLHHVLRSSALVGQMRIRSKGIRPSQERLYWEDLADIRLSLPELALQQRIADFLDDQVARIDNIIAARRRQMALVRESVSHVLVEAARDQGATLTSPLAWFPAWRQDWTIQRLAWVVRCLDGQRVPLNSVERGARQGAFPYYGASTIVDYVDDYLFDGEFVLVGEDGAALENPHFDVVQRVSGRVWVNNHAHVLEASGVDVNYLAHFMRCVDRQLLISGATRPKITQEDLLSIPIVIPSMDSQAQLVAGCAERIAQNEAGMALLREHVGRMEDLRRSLITAAVTGEFDVSSADGSRVPA